MLSARYSSTSFRDLFLSSRPKHRQALPQNYQPMRSCVLEKSRAVCHPPNNHFDDATLFPLFFFQTKNKSRRSIDHTKFSNYLKFHKNPLQCLWNMGLRACYFIQRNVCNTLVST